MQINRTQVNPSFQAIIVSGKEAPPTLEANLKNFARKLLTQENAITLSVDKIDRKPHSKNTEDLFILQDIGNKDNTLLVNLNERVLALRLDRLFSQSTDCKGLHARYEGEWPTKENPLLPLNQLIEKM